MTVKEALPKAAMAPFKLPTILILSLRGSYFSNQHADSLLLTLLSKAVLHESTTPLDFQRALDATKPSAILVTDPAVTDEAYLSVLHSLLDYVRLDGGTVVFMGSFNSVIPYDAVTDMFHKHWHLPWSAGPYTREPMRVNPRVDLLSTKSLVLSYYPQALFLKNVAPDDSVYRPRVVGNPLTLNMASAAYTAVGKGRVGYVGDVGCEDEPEKVVLTMCGLNARD